MVRTGDNILERNIWKPQEQLLQACGYMWTVSRLAAVIRTERWNALMQWLKGERAKLDLNDLAGLWQLQN